MDNNITYKGHNMTYKGHNMTIEQDTDTESPRDWDNLGTMYCKHSKYTLGDKQIQTEIDSQESFEYWLKQTQGDIAVILPLYLYDHSAITMYTSDSTDIHQHAAWDSSMVGWIVVTKDLIRKTYKVKRITKKLLAKVEQMLRQEVKTYDQFLTGDVYGYTTDNDSCWGFYGYDECLEEAKSVVDYEIEQKLQAKLAKTKQLIKSRVPVIYRSA